MKMQVKYQDSRKRPLALLWIWLFLQGIWTCSAAMEPPTITSSSSTTTTIDVAWSAATNTNFDNYIVLYQGQNVDVEKRNVSVLPSVTMESLVGLVPGESYSVSVVVVNGSTMAGSEPLVITTNLNPPTITSLESLNPTHLVVSWSSPSTDYVEGYLITYVGTYVDVSGRGSFIGGALHMAEIDNLMAGDTYEVTVSARSGAGLVSWASEQVQVTMKLNQPEITSLSSTNDTITITWLNSPDYIESYRIQLTGQNVDTMPRDFVDQGTSVGTTLGNLTAGETYSIVVTAESGTESTDSLAVLKTTVPNAPTILGLISTHTSINVTWTSSETDHIDQYIINYHGINVDTSPRNVTVGNTATTVIISSLQSGDTYVITVTSFSGMEKAESREVKRTTKLDKPMVSFASITTTTFTIFWTLHTSFVESLKLDFEGLNVDTEPRNMTVSGQVNIVVLRGFTPGETYNITATVISGSESTASDEISVTTKLNNPTITALIATNSTLEVTWTSPPSDYVESYRVVYTSSSGGGSADTTGVIREIVLSGFTPGITLAVSVEAVTAIENAASEPQFVTLFPNKPIITSTVSLSTSIIGIAWQSLPQDIISSYELHYTGQNVDTIRREMALPKTTLSYNVTGLMPGETYSMSVTALTIGVVEDRRAESLAVMETTALNSPSINLLTSTSTTITITWSSMPQDFVQFYTIRIVDRNINATKSSDTIILGSFNRVTVQDLIPGHTYDVTVIANSSYVYAQSASREETLNPQSVQLRENSSAKHSITVEWDPPFGLVQYYTIACSHGTPSHLRINYTMGTNVASCNDLWQPGNDYTIIVVSHVGEKLSEQAVKVITALPDGVNLTESTSTTTSVQAIWSSPTGAADEFTISCDPPDEATPSPSRIMFIPSQLEYSASCVNLAGPGKLYTMTVTTVSGSKISRSSTIQLTALPKPVYNLYPANIKTTSITISWRKDPTCPTCAYDSFLATYTPDSPASPTKINAPAIEDYYSTMFVHLMPGKEYTFVVTSERNGKLSSDVSLLQRTKPAQITMFSIPTITNSSITIHWIHPEGENNRYRVAISPAEGAVSLLNDPGNPGVSVTMLTPGKMYNVSVYTVSGIMESNPTQYSFTTQSYTPGPILNLHVSVVDKNSRQVTFDPPDQPNGVIASYIIRYSGTAEGRRNHAGTLSTTGSTDVEVNGLKPGFRYVFTVFAVNDYGPGVQTHSQPIYLIVYPPDIPTEPDGSRVVPEAAEGTGVGTIIASTTTITVVLEEGVYGHGNGELLLYTIIVAEEDGVGSYQPGSGTDPSPLPNWTDVKGTNPSPPYQAFEPRTYPFPPPDSNSRKRRSAPETVDIVIGNESCAGSTGYCNGPLKDDTSYVFHFRVFTQAGYADTAFSEPIKTDGDSTLALALGLGICFTLVFLAVAALAILIMIRKRRKRYGGATAKQGNENKGFEAEVPALNNQAISLKKKRSSRPVRLADFPSHYSSMKADSEYLFSEEYEELRNVGRSQPIEAATLLANRSKNRFANIQPYDHTRVKLMPIDDEEGSDYINANYMPGYNSPREFIACQGPLPGTEDDMWRMIWEQRVETIVMVTQLVEKGRLKCHQYWPDENKPQFYGEIQVVLMSEHYLKHWTVRDFTLQMGGKVHSVQHFNFTSWPDHGVPEATGVLLSFVKTIRNQIPNNSTPTVVHCSAGVGRTGTFIALDRLMQHMREHDYVDIFGIVSEMRMHRNHMVQTEQQYVFIHECVIDILQGGASNGKVNYKDNKDDDDDEDEHFL